MVVEPNVCIVAENNDMISLTLLSGLLKYLFNHNISRYVPDEGRRDRNVDLINICVKVPLFVRLHLSSFKSKSLAVNILIENMNDVIR